MVGSLWVLKSYETIKITRAINLKKSEIGFKGEMHFKEIDKNNISQYLALLGTLIENSSSISFKGLGVLRAGLYSVDDTLNKLFYQTEEESKDKLSMMEIELQLRHASTSIFNGNVYIDVVEAEDSTISPLMQISDLFVSSISRTLNREKSSDHPKDLFADKFLGAFGLVFKDEKFDELSECVSFS
ncbi:hypothetical protein AO354_35675 [Pseudomonas syringae pv. syringae]|nr:hypothetical protein AO354_35675 [Pseudomonas syringae pv. syringae]